MAGQKGWARKARIYGRGWMGQKRRHGRGVSPFEFGCGFGVFVGVSVFGVGEVGVQVWVTWVCEEQMSVPFEARMNLRELIGNWWRWKRRILSISRRFGR